MGVFSSEPPRTDCVLHLPLGSVRNDTTTDTSPYANDGHVPTPDDTAHHWSPMGAAIGTDKDADSVVRVADDDTLDGFDDGVTFSFWYWDKDGSQNTGGSNYHFIANKSTFSGSAFFFGSGGLFRISDSSDTQHAIGTSFDAETWNHFVVRYDPDTGLYEIYKNGELDARDDIGGGLTIQSNTDPVQILPSGAGPPSGRVSDFRIYSTALSDEHVQSLYEMGAMHLWSDNVADAWSNDGIPYRGGNKRFGDTFAEAHAYYARQLDYVLDARHIGDAAGEQLDKLGRGFGIRREQNESDERYRARIKGTLIAGRSDGSFDDIADAAAEILGTETTNVALDADYIASPGQCTLTVQQSDLDDSALTASDVSTILEDVVLAGHRIQVQTQTDTPFTLTDDSTPNDPALGLTSDSISTGGELIEDI